VKKRGDEKRSDVSPGGARRAAGASAGTSEPARVRARDREAWRAWLQRHHATAAEVWLVLAKAHTGKPTITYDEAVEEALCFGWIDTTVRRLDEDHYMQRFTPRSNPRTWSQSNLDRFARMEAAGRMTDAGRAKLPKDVTAPPPRAATGDAAPEWMLRELAAHPAAERFFGTLTPGYRRDYVRYVTEAKREETRARRLAQAIRRLEAGHKRVVDVDSSKA
jgi:uncharacterized protein YdeI (YjbR/CyaY-like superfamily)